MSMCINSHQYYPDIITRDCWQHYTVNILTVCTTTMNHILLFHLWPENNRICDISGNRWSVWRVFVLSLAEVSLRFMVHYTNNSVDLLYLLSMDTKSCWCRVCVVYWCWKCRGTFPLDEAIRLLFPPRQNCNIVGNHLRVRLLVWT